MNAFRKTRIAAGALVALAMFGQGVAAAGPGKPGANGNQPQAKPASAMAPTAIEKAMEESDGTKGYTIKALGQQSWQAGKNRNFVFEPASTIKILHLVQAVRAVQAGSASYEEQMEVSDKYMGSCPLEPEDWWQDSYTIEEPLWNTLSAMMWASDNARTEAVKKRFTQAGINYMASSVIGTTDTLLQHRLGCNSEAAAAPNQLTLNDASRIYEKVFLPGLLDDQHRAELRELMPNWHPILLSAVAKEFGWFTPAYDPDEAEYFYANTKISYKAGSYAVSSPQGVKQYRSIAGWLELPYVCHSGDNEWTCPKQFTFGLFIDKATNSDMADSAYEDGLYELFRHAVRKTIQSYD